ncbi:MAG: pyridoxal 5'-phosphate synthase glutaminase subunit PdxT [Kiritimatiellae bacterium]|nr:pyridoxal 5'-phosphate synthase glutaminase subunit PdxT [Kiritimatiellia bacterium]
MNVGVLSVQGAFAEMAAHWRARGADVFEIRQRSDLDRGMDLLALPGGESTVQGKLLKDLGLFDPLKAAIDGGLPVYATCAGLILLAEKIDDPGRRDDTRPEKWFGSLPVAVRRNAYGRQLGSFVTVGAFDGKPNVPMTFIRAPAITEVLSPDVEVLSVFKSAPTAVRWRNITAFTWHPELNAATVLAVSRMGRTVSAESIG